jgi:hypothetical protein
MGVGETNRTQQLLPFLDLEEGCGHPATRIEKSRPQAPESIDRETGEVLSRTGIPEIPEQAEFRSMWNDLTIINYGPSHEFQKQQSREFTILKNISKLNLKAREIAKLMLDQLLAPANLTAKILTQKVEENINATENKPELLRDIINFTKIFRELTKTVQKNDFGGNFYKRDLLFQKFINPDHNKLHAARWVENLEKNLTNFISKIRDNKPVAWEFHKYLYLAKKAIETIRPKETPVQPRRDGRASASGEDTPYNQYSV